MTDQEKERILGWWSILPEKEKEEYSTGDMLSFEQIEQIYNRRMKESIEEAKIVTEEDLKQEEQEMASKRKESGLLQKEENAQTKLTKIGFAAYESLEGVREIAEIAIKSKIVPDSLSSIEKVMSVMLMGKDLKIPPMIALNNIHNIQGKPTLSVHLVGALLRRAGIQYIFTKDCQGVDATGEDTNVRADTKDMYNEIRFRIPFGKDKNGKQEYVDQYFKFYWSEAAAMGLTTKDNWIKMKRIMFRNRTLVIGARLAAPDALLGFYETSELADTFDVSYTVDDEGNAKIK